ncbi:MAG: bifunctional diaminohydroxyphosphoribosylaminopyrimidine deaminase/5-amino-6-(5-phosphoribosylamino)uracil reductase RibD [Gelidibacter sp.]
MKIHEKYINRCIEIAKNGLGTTAPNPMVGCVIVYNQQIIGEGFTSAYGGNHAEVNALNSVKDKSLLMQSTLYVTLEPCSHFGKTPPCADTIVNHQIPKVVIGTIDTHSKVAGKGIEKLKAAGCEVMVGILEDECKAHLRRFFTFHNKKRPYIILKWAETADGFIAPKTKSEQKPIWITNEISRQLVHKWRAEEQAILVGTNTVSEDNPSLTVRDWTGKDPIRVVLDKDLKLSKTSKVFDDKSDAIVICDENESFPITVGQKKEWSVHSPIKGLPSATFHIINWNLSNAIAKQICDVLYTLSINSIIIEGGRQTLQTFIDEHLWDEARVFTGNSKFIEGVKAPKLYGKLISEEKLLDDNLKIYKND